MKYCSLQGLQSKVRNSTKFHESVRNIKGGSVSGFMKAFKKNLSLANIETHSETIPHYSKLVNKNNRDVRHLQTSLFCGVEQYGQK